MVSFWGLCLCGSSLLRSLLIEIFENLDQRDKRREVISRVKVTTCLVTDLDNKEHYTHVPSPIDMKRQQRFN
uniref:Secreted protein n=1 Tax=Caenorhabditis tropicalis TaxID=1561998 RepID=A0A1I7US40_9PELO